MSLANHPAMARKVQARKGPRKGSELRSTGRFHADALTEYHAPAYGDTREDRHGGRQHWHSRTDARPFSTTTGFNSRL